MDRISTHWKLLVLVILFCSGAPLSQAASIDHKKATESDWDVQAVLSIGLTFGGDKLKELTVDTFFDGEETENIKAGESVYFAGGASFKYHSFETQLTIGYYIDGIFGDNGETSFVRYPLELLTFWSFEKLRLGGGAALHLNPKFEFDIDNDFLPKETVRFDDATGFVFQVDYAFARQFRIGVRFTDIDYETSDLPAKVEGNSIGLTGTAIF